MKKLFAAIVILLLVFSITSCSLHDAEDYNDYNYESESETTTDAETPTVTEENRETASSDISAEKLTEESLIESDKEIITEKTENNLSSHKEPVAVTSQPTKKPDAIATTKVPVVPTTRVQTTSSSKKLPSYSPESEVISLFNAVNTYRTQNGLNNLVLDSTLCKMAYIRAQEENTLKGHTRPNNTPYYTVLDEYNYNYCGCGENLSYGKNVSVISTLDRWKGSTSHNLNMIDEHWTKAGIAMCKNADGSYNIDLLFAC